MRYRIEAFEPGRHHTKEFLCGSAGQDNFLRRTARRQQRDGYTCLFVATAASEFLEERLVLGFYAINAHAIGRADLPPESAPRAPRSNLMPAGYFRSAPFRLLPARRALAKRNSSRFSARFLQQMSWD